MKIDAKLVKSWSIQPGDELANGALPPQAQPPESRLAGIGRGRESDQIRAV
jgi:hypothetical protein